MKAAVVTLAGMISCFMLGCEVPSPADDFEAKEMLPFPPDTAEWYLVWRDEFNQTEIDTTKWSFQRGDGCDIDLCGWGNNELQWYTEQNAAVEEGFLVITARRDEGSSREYTSSRIRTAHKGDRTYGRVDVRASLPVGQGLWPAIWMLPTDNAYGTWAASGEIDIMEALGHLPDRVYGTLHYGSEWPENTHTGDSLQFSGTSIDDFHIYSIVWSEESIEWYVDGRHYQTQTEWYTKGAEYPAPFDRRFHLLLNVAIGGEWPGYPDSTTQFPQKMNVDYVRVYQPSR